MDDMEMLGALLTTPGPSDEVVDRGRGRLQQATRGTLRHGSARHGSVRRNPVRRNLVRRNPVHRWPGGWLTGGLGLAAVAGAIAFVAASITIAPAAPQSHPPAAIRSPAAAHPSAAARPRATAHPAIAEMSAKQILLAAAAAAAASPEGSGTYWHEKVSYSWGPVWTQETWITHDGALYVREGNVVWPFGSNGFEVGTAHLTLAQLDRLPTDPAALTAWLTRSLMGPQADIPSSVMPGEVAAALSCLLYEVPAPPAVRAAAYRALASRADVKRLGAVDGGQGLLLLNGGGPPATTGGKLPAGEIRLVISPVTLQLISTTNFEGTETIIVQNWTNQIPPILGPPAKPKKTHPGQS